jgi:nitroreductase
MTHKAKSVASLIALFTLSIILSVSSVACAASFPLEQTVSLRQSIRNYTSENITADQLLQVLQVAYGFWNGHRSTPTIGQNYSLTVFVVNATASYQYAPETNTIILYAGNVSKETIRPHDQGWPSNSSAVLIVVWNKTEEVNQYFASVDAGCLVQNVYLGAASLDLGTCCVGGIDSAGLSNDLQLSNNLVPLLVMPLGYPVTPYPPASPNYSFMTGNLPPVQYSQLSLEESIENIQYAQKWSSENLSSQHLSELLWAAYGYTNITNGYTFHRTTPSAYDIYPLSIFVSNATGVYKYLPENHSVTKVVQGDKRLDITNASSGQAEMAKAPAIFLVAYNSSLDGDLDSPLPHEFVEVDAGTVIQQLVLEASAWNLSANLISSGLGEWNGTAAQELRNITGSPSTLIPLYTVAIGLSVKDTTPPTIGTPSQDPASTSVEAYQNVTVTANIIDTESGVREAILSYTTDEGQTWTNTTMINTTNDLYEAKVPGFPTGTSVQYKITAYDNADNSATENNSGQYYVYTVIPEIQNSAIMIFIIAISTAVLAILKKRKKHSQKSVRTICGHRRKGVFS